jgi:glycosyltransferase involved in cell wall biosynthesis
MIPVLYLHELGPISGGETSLLMLWQHLDRVRVRPILAAPCPSPLADRARHLGVEVRAVSYCRLRGLISPRGVALVAYVRRLIQTEGVRIVHGNTPVTNLLGTLASLGTGCRVVWHERTLPEHHHWDVDRWFAFWPDRIICNSSAVVRRFRGRGRTVVILNGVSLEQFRPDAGGTGVREKFGVSPETVLVGMVGNFSPVKGHEVFLQAATGLIRHGKNVQFWVVGGETFDANQGRERALKAMAAALKLEAHVRFLGRRDDMPAIMDALDILAAPSYAEACSRAILEAMAAGTPVIATRVGGNPELVEDGATGILVPAGNPEVLGNAIQSLVRDTGRRRQLGQAGRARAAAMFTIERQVKQTQAVYDALLRSFEDVP